MSIGFQLVDLPDDEEPLRNRESEEDEMCQAGSIARPALNDESDDQAGVLSHQVVTQFANKQERDDAGTDAEFSVALFRIVPSQLGMLDTRLCPSLGPS